MARARCQDLLNGTEGVKKMINFNWGLFQGWLPSEASEYRVLARTD
jgi:hypothetical protein